MRSRLDALVGRVQCSFVHNLLPPSLHVPQFVINYLSKGGKFIPESNARTLPSVQKGLDELSHRLQVAAYMKGKNLNDDHELPKNLHRCKIKSAWQPPSNNHVELFKRLVLADLAHYQQKRFVPNTGSFDRMARNWLKTHKDEIMVVDCDKNLGDAIVSREYIEQLVQQSLDEGFTRIDIAEYDERTRLAQLHWDTLLVRAVASTSIDRRTLSFRRSGLQTANPGSF